ncbi:MAG: hypothetical protein HN778_01090 [Prolixibacteraceae bacterium]|nr:hypothetical protein [Prolixibacteraceae bacterium]MBT6005803.1 hypothetical protein [Prolixibacteraceae bacterium]MBT6765383.1 hypothetical protein [Prolixibacteraceae bacterium]MBT6998744.1 hypothetical protein [Prolixibacteraceae bacterium]MBT7393404.1 hypothetical protein [Prolixibacteraceae bacterium]
MLVVCTLIFTNHESVAQESEQETNISYFTGGFGVMEVLNIGFDLENNNSQFGLKVGGFAADRENLLLLISTGQLWWNGNIIHLPTLNDNFRN